MSDNLQPYGTQDTAPPSEPLTREEQYLSAIAGVTAATDIPEKPLTRVEKYLNKIVENGGGGGGGGTSNYNDLSNKPQINSTTLTGNKSSSDLGLQDKVLGAWTAGTATTHSTPASTDTVLQALEKIDNNQRNDETNISNCSTKLTGVDSTANNAIKMNNGVTLYFGSTTPSNPQNGDWWLD